MTPKGDWRSKIANTDFITEEKEQLTPFQLAFQQQINSLNNNTANNRQKTINKKRLSFMKQLIANKEQYRINIINNEIIQIQNKTKNQELEQIQSFIEQERLSNTSINEITKTVRNIFGTHLTYKHIQQIIQTMDKTRKSNNLYHMLNKTPAKNSYLIMPYFDGDMGWNIRLFKYCYTNKEGGWVGHTLHQSSEYMIKGNPNLFQCFYHNPQSYTYYQCRGNTKILVFPFYIKNETKRMNEDTFILPDFVLQELYIKDFPQLRYCFQLKNQRFRKFIAKYR